MSYIELVAIYHADGSLFAELRYLLAKLWGRSPCALCEITHGFVKEKAGFESWRAGLGIPFRTLHLDERSPELQRFTEGKTPCVVGRSLSGWELLLSKEELESCEAKLIRLDSLLRAKLGLAPGELSAGPSDS